MTEQKKPTKKFLSGKYRKILLMLMLDIVFAFGSYAIARSISSYGDHAFLTVGYQKFEPLIACMFMLITVAMLIFLDCYNTMWRYAGRVEFFKIAVAYFAAAFVLHLFKIVMQYPFEILIPSPTILMYLMFSILFSAGMRYNYGIRGYLFHLKNRLSGKAVAGVLRTVVIGAGYTGTGFVNRCINNPADGFFPVAILDDDPEKQHKKMHGVKVAGGLDRLDDTVRRFRAQAIVIAITSLSKRQLKELHARCVKHNIPVKLMSDLKDPTAGELNGHSLGLKDIKIEDLLGREEFKVNQDLLDGSVKDKVVLVTGGAGSIGSELCRQALVLGCKKLIVFDNHENGMFELNEEFKERFDADRYDLAIGSVREENKLKEIFERYSPHVVFHAAAYKHVPMMEISATEAIKNNVLGTLKVIRAAEKAGTERFVFISTDKAVNPANIMGASKRIAEMAVQSFGASSRMQMAAVRFGNVLGSNGSVIPIFLRQIKEGGPITLTDRGIKRYFMTIPEAVRLVLQAGSLAKKGDIFVLDMGEPVLIYDLACDLCRISGLTPERDIEICVCGLRPGEKMFEELRYDKEAVDKTAHEGIFVTRMEPLNHDAFLMRLSRLEALAEAEDEKGTTNVIFQIVPSAYRSMKKDEQVETKEFKAQGVRE